MRSILRFLLRPISASRIDDRFAQLASYGCALLVLVAGTLKLTKLGLNETHLFFGLLLVLCLSMLCMIFGTLVRPQEKAE